MLRIGTHNVNGIRASLRRGFASWLETRELDVIGLQEVRCPIDALPLGAFGNYHTVYAPGRLAGRNGVALLSRHKIASVRSWGCDTVSIAPQTPPKPLDPSTTKLVDYTLARELRDFSDEGRYIEIDLADFPLTIASLYLPKGGLPEELNTTPGRDGKIDPDNPRRYARKMSFLAGFAKHLTRARQNAARNKREFLIVGDFNIAHTKADLKNWRSNQRSEGFLPEERAWFDGILSPKTLTDVVRSLHPGVDGPYSWWSWMGQAFARDTGWRIDYHLASPGLAQAARSAVVDREANANERLSDHSPVIVEYDVS